MKKIIAILCVVALVFTTSSYTFNSKSFDTGGDDLIGLWEPSNG